MEKIFGKAALCFGSMGVDICPGSDLFMEEMKGAERIIFSVLVGLASCLVILWVFREINKETKKNNCKCWEERRNGKTAECFKWVCEENGTFYVKEKF